MKQPSRNPVIVRAATGQLSCELQNLAERGLWAVTRLNELYPARLRDTLKQQAKTGLLTPYAPDAGFSVGAAMGRNKLISTG